MLGAGGTTVGDVLLVQDAQAAHCREATQPVRDQLGRCGQRCLGEFLDRLLGEWTTRQAHEDSLPRLGGLHRGVEGDLVLRAPAALAPGRWSPR